MIFLRVFPHYKLNKYFLYNIILTYFYNYCKKIFNFKQKRKRLSIDSLFKHFSFCWKIFIYNLIFQSLHQCSFSNPKSFFNFLRYQSRSNKIIHQPLNKAHYISNPRILLSSNNSICYQERPIQGLQHQTLPNQMFQLLCLLLPISNHSRRIRFLLHYLLLLLTNLRQI